MLLWEYILWFLAIGYCIIDIVSIVMITRGGATYNNELDIYDFYLVVLISNAFLWWVPILLVYQIGHILGMWYFIGMAWITFWSTEIDPIPITLNILGLLLVIFTIIKGKRRFKKPICKKCQKKLSRKTKYCYSCGERVGGK